MPGPSLRRAAGTPGRRWLPCSSPARRSAWPSCKAESTWPAGIGSTAAAPTPSKCTTPRPIAGRWRRLLPQGLNHPGAAVAGERFYVLGGDDGRGPVATNYEYDPRSNSWAIRAPMPDGAERAHGRRHRRPDLRGRRRTGLRGPHSGSLRSRDRPLDSARRPCLLARNHLAGGAIGGRLYVVGGRPPLTLAVLEVFDPATGAWTTRSPMPTGRSGHAAAVLRGCLYVLRRRGQFEHAFRRFSAERGL